LTITSNQRAPEFSIKSDVIIPIIANYFLPPYGGRKQQEKKKLTPFYTNHFTVTAPLKNLFRGLFESN
jgi:hypothetical protein